MKDHFTVLIDNREKKNELRFPATVEIPKNPSRPYQDDLLRVRIETKKVCLVAGDYLLEGYEDRTVIEAKRGIDEIATNCTSPVRRANFARELDHLVSHCRHPVLLLRGSPAQYLKATTRSPHPEVALSSFLRMCLERKVAVHLVPFNTPSQRLNCATWAIHLLIAGLPL